MDSEFCIVENVTICGCTVYVREDGDNSNLELAAREVGILLRAEAEAKQTVYKSIP